MSKNCFKTTTNSIDSYKNINVDVYEGIKAWITSRMIPWLKFCMMQEMNPFFFQPLLLHQLSMN